MGYKSKEFEDLSNKIKQLPYSTFLLKFSMENCPPCKLIEKNLQSLYKIRQNLKERVISLEYMNNKQLFIDYKIKSVPALIFIDKEMKTLKDVRFYIEEDEMT